MDTLLELLEDAKDLLWNDDDEYVIGYNSGLDRAINIVADYFEPVSPTFYGRGGFKCGACKRVIEFGGQEYCGNCGRRIKWKNAYAEHADTTSAVETGTSAAT